MKAKRHKQGNQSHCHYLLSIVFSALLRFTAFDYVFGFFCVIFSATSEVVQDNFSCSIYQGFVVLVMLLSHVKPLIKPVCTF